MTAIDFPNSPSTNDTFTAGGVTWRYDGSKWGIDAVSGPSYVTSLPTSPVDGQEVYYAANATNGVIWHLRYRSGSSSSYKWEFVGGGPLSINSIAETGAVSMTANQWADVSTAISITAPLDGDYFVSASSSVLRSSGTNVVFIGIKNGATDDVLNGIVTITLANYWHHTSVGGIVTNVGAGGAPKTIALRYLTDANITNGFRRRSACLEIRPIRVI